jgi:hypothetical protein
MDPALLPEHRQRQTLFACFLLFEVYIHHTVQARLISMKRFLIADLSAHLSKEWPSSFSDVFHDERGFLVARFDSHLSSTEGDLLGYMNKWVCVY